MKKIFLYLVLVLPINLLFSQDYLKNYNKAVTSFNNGWQKGDFSKWAEADSIFKSLENNKDIPTERAIWSSLYSLQMRLVRYPEKDLELLNTLLDNYEESNVKDKHLINLLNYYQLRYLLVNKNNSALENLKNSILELKKQDSIDFYTLSLTYNTLGQHYYDARDYTQAGVYFHKARHGYKKSQLDYLLSDAYQSISAAYYNTDKADSSIVYMEKAYNTLKSLKKPNQRKLGRLAFNLGMMHQGKTGGLTEAEFYLKESIEAERKAGNENTPSQVLNYTLLADNYYFIKDLKNAELYAQKAKSLSNEVLKEKDVYYKSLVGMTESRIETALGNHERSIAVINKVVEESIDYFGENDKFTLQAFKDKAIAEYAAGNFELAEEYYLRALAVSKIINRTFSTTAVLNGLIDIYFEEEMYDKALPYCLEEENILRKEIKSDSKLKITSKVRVAKALIGMENLLEAKLHLDTIETKIVDVKDNGLTSYYYNTLNEYYLKAYRKGEKDKLIKAKSNIDNLLKNVIEDKVYYNYQDSKIFYSKTIVPYIDNSLSVYHKLYNENPSEENLNSLFTLLEINKSSALLDGLLDSSLRAKQNIPESLTEKEVNAQNEINTINEELFTVKDDLRKKELIETQIKLTKKLDSIQAIYKKDYSNYYDAKTLQTPKSLEYYQERYVSSADAIIEYYVSDQNIYALIITQKEIQFLKINDAAAIKDASQKLREALVTQKPFMELSKSLSEKILPELDNSIRNIIFITDGVLSKIPFEVLSYNNEFLINAFTISYAGSLQLYDEQVKVAKNTKMKWLGYAPKYKDASLSSNTVEVNEIGKIINGNSVTGTNATKESFINQSKDYSVVHLATHGKLSNINPMLNSLVFYGEDEESSELSASEIYGLDLNANLAVLSACDTGSGKIEAGEGVMSMSRAFTYAGVSSTIVSLWKVPDQQTSKIMVSFYENLEKGQPKNEALKNAKLSFITNTDDENLKHPYYWAGFILTGDVGEINTRINPFWYVLGGGVLVLAGLFFYNKSKKKTA
ncbi:CHAT domain-containing protein [Patiriisocius hiemis]|uniref:CHAT domain-containing tetratricopeptide repeat protein n=1 Tax=Patiriisocius hiemis TaxID=3075604 RepID=A0ABU2YC65_9FLAO|nr:CHAT domain-containing tetratricopeptide repeat protein [Constantimarinum sp. W242]MDT0555390.1 CHAT domain-containing tetratricopeptide repeat protein [Constantimarinum sp. W242]